MPRTESARKPAEVDVGVGTVVGAGGVGAVLPAGAFAVSVGVSREGIAGGPATTTESRITAESDLAAPPEHPTIPRPAAAIIRFLINLSLRSGGVGSAIVPSADRLVNSMPRTSLARMMRSAGRVGACALLCFATPLIGQRSDRRLIDRGAIAAAGWHRLGDLIAALPPGSTASVDGFNHEMRGSRIGFAATNGVSATWLIRLDGQVVPISIGGTWILDEIPVAIPQLDSIVISEGPRLTDGRAALLGTIDLYTRRPRGTSLVVDYQHGDETGDPGPYRYTSRSTPNVEKLGPFTSGAATIARGAAALDAAVRYSSLNITDANIIARLGPAFPAYQSDVNASGGSAVLTFDALGGRTYVLGGRGRFTGLFPLSTVSGNQQARVIASHAGISGSVTALTRAWRYAATITDLDLGALGAVPLLAPTQQRRFFDGFVEGNVWRNLRAGVGGTVGRRETSIDERREATARGWTTYDGGMGDAGFALEHSGGKMRASGTAHLRRIVGDSDQVDVSVTQLRAWRPGDFEWMDQPTPDSAGTTSTEMRVDLTTRQIMQARPTWYARVYSYSGIGTHAVTGLAGGVVATTPLTSRVTARLRGEVSQLLGDAGTGERSTPAGYLDGAISARAAGGFNVALAGRYAPSTHWVGFADEVPITQRVDFSVNKSMWRDRIRAQLVMRNLLNAAERTHPDGAQWNLRTHLAVTIALPSGAGAP